ncbi:MAG: hypothetical protein CMP39_07530 [Rickettsiales bacterium]|nr:hypothetical protein [Rickettsiales bacterium]
MKLTDALKMVNIDHGYNLRHANVINNLLRSSLTIKNNDEISIIVEKINTRINLMLETAHIYDEDDFKNNIQTLISTQKVDIIPYLFNYRLTLESRFSAEEIKRFKLLSETNLLPQ